MSYLEYAKMTVPDLLKSVESSVRGYEDEDLRMNVAKQVYTSFFQLNMLLPAIAQLLNEDLETINKSPLGELFNAVKKNEKKLQIRM